MEPQRELILKDRIYGNMFQSFVSYACERSTFFSLTHNRQLIYKRENPRQDIFLKKLMPYKVKSIQCFHWFHMYTKKTDPIFVDVFHFNEMTAKIILSTYSDLYLGYYSNCEWMPEDICFFWNDKLWLGTVSHECWCTVFTQGKKKKKELKHFGEWDESENDVSSEIIDLKNFL